MLCSTFINAALAAARNIAVTGTPDVTRLAIRHALSIPAVRAAYDLVEEKGELHKRVGRLIKQTLRARTIRRVFLDPADSDVIKSYTQLAY